MYMELFRFRSRDPSSWTRRTTPTYVTFAVWRADMALGNDVETGHAVECGVGYPLTVLGLYTDRIGLAKTLRKIHDN